MLSASGARKYRRDASLEAVGGDFRNDEREIGMRLIAGKESFASEPKRKASRGDELPGRLSTVQPYHNGSRNIFAVRWRALGRTRTARSGPRPCSPACERRDRRTTPAG